jgi:hypothetical protein
MIGVRARANAKSRLGQHGIQGLQQILRSIMVLSFAWLVCSFHRKIQRREKMDTPGYRVERKRTHQLAGVFFFSLLCIFLSISHHVQKPVRGEHLP